MQLLFYLLWFLLNGRVTTELAVIGALITALLYAFMIAALKWSPKKDLQLLKALPIFFLYLLNLVKEIVLSACTVAALAFNPKAQPEPVLVEFSSGIREERLNVILANSITLTPGTITVSQQGDHFLVHALRKEYAEGLEDSSFIRLLRRFP